MAEKISVQIALEGGKEVERQLADIGATGQKAFNDLAKSAEQVGGFKNLKTEEVTKSLAAAGVEGKELAQVLQTVGTAVRFEKIVLGAQALEKGLAAVGTAAAAAGIGLAAIGTAVVAGATALAGYIPVAAKTAEALRSLSDLSGQSMESVSALQIAFAQDGVSAEQFGKAFTDLEVRVQDAARTMADDIEQSARRIEQAHLAEEQATLGVEQAELNLRKVRGLPVNPITERRLKIEQAELQLQAALLAQAKALHDARVAEANDLQQIIKLYQQMGQGANVAFDPLTTQATKTQALLATLAQAGSNWKNVLADILQNASELERIQIGRALGLDPAIIETLSKGSAALREAEEAARRLGIALTDVDRANLKQATDSWNTFFATVNAILGKLAAQLAPFTAAIANLATAFVTAFATGDFSGAVTALEGLGGRLVELFSQIGSAAATAFGVAVLAGLQGLINNALAVGEEVARAFESGLMPALQRIAQAIPLTLIPGFGLIIKLLQDLMSGLGGAGGGSSPSGLAGGGMIGGRGTGTSDSNLAWVSRGEHIMPARAVAQPGVLAFLEALRRSGGNLRNVLDGMGRFALGGLVPRPALAFAGGGAVGSMSNVTINFPGLQPISGLRASAQVVDQLQRAAALAQVRSGGRKPSRYS